MNDVRDFRRICHDVARGTGGAVTGFRMTEHVTPNFHQAIIQYPDSVVAVVVARDAPIAAIAYPRSIEPADGRSSGPLEFINEPDLVAALAKQSTFQVLTSAELGQPFDAVDWPHLTPSDIACWKPTTGGEGSDPSSARRRFW
jgi:hypothetical protein